MHGQQNIIKYIINMFLLFIPKEGFKHKYNQMIRCICFFHSRNFKYNIVKSNEMKYALYLHVFTLQYYFETNYSNIHL